ncbi:MAG: nickel-responsive transcriptional regulator NikR [Bacteroidales bacterium]|nr:nickel-responsive transcriptional regulator NikR [Bacteroidales bacterium]MCF8344831.1 nickel-responsive transcriptional regulator NikR [Bacteroidales bacterium]MCF8377044.1 nickel-responsive transcriptional regulator NikR [Bacteroidales bacterium]MCF8400918.1 nickel-responsive transcriptional regulator NikR [Bacteroidales bacterium]
MKVKRFGVSLEENLLGRLDRLVEEKQFPNRSQAIRFLINKYIVEEKWESDDEVAGAIVLVYNHHKRDLQNKSTEVQHNYHDLILSVQHVHLNHDNCLETIAVKGSAKRLRALADKLISIKGIKHGELVMSTHE